MSRYLKLRIVAILVAATLMVINTPAVLEYLNGNVDAWTYPSLSFFALGALVLVDQLLGGAEALVNLKIYIYILVI